MPNIRGVPANFSNGRPIPAQYTTDPDVESRSAIEGMAKLAARVRGQHMAEGRDPYQEPDYTVLEEIVRKKSLVEPEQARLRSLYRRWDNFYYPSALSTGGADHWKEDTPRAGGRVHISVNVHPAYVDVPASLQAVRPIINYVPAGSSLEEREAAGRREALLFEWWDQVGMDLKAEDICRIRGLYGDAAVKVYWDAEAKVPQVQVLESIENLYMGYGDSDFRRVDWAIYCYGLSPQAAEEEYGVKVVMHKDTETKNYYPWAYGGTHDDPLGHIYANDREERARRQTAYELAQIEVYDYWYKVPTKPGKRPQIWNAIYVGNYLAKPPTHHPEYDDIPYIVIPNSRVPGLPYGKSELFDVEQILREKDERLSQAAQMIQSVVGGQMWQLVGPEAPDEVPENAIPKPNKVASPGPGNELRALQPFVPQFAIEDLLKRLDREAAAITGMNDLLLGLAPAQILGSSKAIAALIANYESRINPKRKLLYQAYRRIWEMAAKVWERKDREVREIIDGQYRLEIKAPELTPRDELETAQMAINLVNSRIWSMERAMDRTGVEDPVEEKVVVREEQTDASLNPASVQAMAQLMAVLQQLGISSPEQAQQQALNSARTLNAAPGGTQSLNGPENAGNAPPEARPANAEGGLLAQTMLQGGEAQGRILSQQEL